MKRYLEIRREIENRILLGEWADGEMLPGENELTHQYGVSRATLRMALRHLEDEKILTTRQGVGRYVNHRIGIVSNLARLESTEELLLRSGTKLKEKLNHFIDIQFTEHEADLLEVTPGGTGKRLVRTRYANDKPVVVSVNLFRPDATPEFPVEGSLLTTMECSFGKIVDYARTTIEIPLPSDPFTHLLQDHHTFTPILRMQQLHFTWKHEPLFLSYDYVNTSYITLSVTRTRQIDS